MVVDIEADIYKAFKMNGRLATGLSGCLSPYRPGDYRSLHCASFFKHKSISHVKILSAPELQFLKPSLHVILFIHNYGREWPLKARTFQLKSQVDHPISLGIID